MIEVLIENIDINSDALDETLRVEFGEKLIGVSAGVYGVIVHLDQSATEADVLQAESLVRVHDPAVKTARQQAREARRDQLEQERITNAIPLNLDDFALQLPLIRRLAQKIAWLERELRDLRDLE